MSQEQQKRAAATFAARLVSDGMFVGLGSGSTSKLVIEALGERVRDGLLITGVPTSAESGDLARNLGIPLTTLGDRELDLTIDGADEVDPNRNLIKGRGGALLDEKLVAVASRRYVIVVDASKLVNRLGERHDVPIEVVRFGWQSTRARLGRAGFSCKIRGGETSFVTNDGNYILDCDAWGDRDLANPDVAATIKSVTGVVEHGLFLGFNPEVVIGRATGVVEVRQG
ncbi:MAG TPA: ribose-5-phosphate isomerase RpiA [Chloroflexota bacterium]|nr:ribose-5-phosphate isomerase RpiA [Chloroflexota bacterium]